jgi:hypothetical protein
MERSALATGSHAHVMVFQALTHLYGMALFGICWRTKTLTDAETPDLEPLIAVLPEEFQREIRSAIAAEQIGCSHHALPPNVSTWLLAARLGSYGNPSGSGVSGRKVKHRLFD